MSHTESHCELPWATSGLLMAHTGGGEGPAARLSVALCRCSSALLVGPKLPACALLREPCVFRLPATVHCPPHFLGRRICPLPTCTHTQPYCRKLWKIPASLDVSWVVCGDCGWRHPGHSDSRTCGAAFSWETGKVCADSSDSRG